MYSCVYVPLISQWWHTVDVYYFLLITEYLPKVFLFSMCESTCYIVNKANLSVNKVFLSNPLLIYNEHTLLLFSCLILIANKCLPCIRVFFVIIGPVSPTQICCSEALFHFKDVICRVFKQM